MSFSIKQSSEITLRVDPELFVSDKVCSSNNESRIVKINYETETSRKRNAPTYAVSLFDQPLAILNCSSIGKLLFSGCTSSPFHFVNSKLMTFQRVNDTCLRIIEVDVPFNLFQATLCTCINIKASYNPNGKNKYSLASIIYNYWAQNEYFVDLSQVSQQGFYAYSYIPKAIASLPSVTILKKTLEPALSMLNSSAFYIAAHNRHGTLACFYNGSEDTVFWASHDDEVVRKVDAAIQNFRGSGTNYWVKEVGVYYQYDTSRYPRIQHSINYEAAQQIDLKLLSQTPS